MFPLRDHNPSTRTPYVTYALIAINALVFYATNLSLDEMAMNRVLYDYALIPARFDLGHVTPVFTSMFMHAGWMHILGNMLFLWIFGDNLEDTMGHLPYAVFYVLSGIAAAYIQYATDPSSVIPVVGASGAIAGVMGGYLLLFPKAKVDIFLFFVVFFRIIPIPAWITLAIWFGLQLFNGLTSTTESGGVAYWAHTGGFVAGAIMILPWFLARGGSAYWRRTEGHPPHPDATYKISRTSIPQVRRNKSR